MSKRLSKLFLLGVMSSVLAAGLIAAPPDEDVRTSLNKYLDEAEKEGFSGAVLVARDGKVLLEKGYGKANVATGDPVLPDTVFTVGSITKQFTAAAILRLEMDGKLSTSDPITKYFDDVPDDKTNITLVHLLTHSAGFEGAIGDDFERIGRDAFVRKALGTELLFEPGSAYEYSNVGYSLLAAIVEKLSGLTYEEYLQKNLFAPAGMKDTGYLVDWDASRLAHGTRADGSDWGTLVGKAFGPEAPGWNLIGNGGIHSTVRDMYKWHKALKGVDVLSAEATRRMYEPRVDEGGGSHYGYGWSIEQTPFGKLITHNGGNPFFKADFLRYEQNDVVVYFTTNARDRRMARIGRPLARIVFTGEVPAFEKKPERIAGPKAKQGTAAARWNLPDTEQGRFAALFLDALRGDESKRRAFVEESFSSRIVERIGGVDDAVGLFSRLEGDAGEFELDKVSSLEAGIRISLRRNQRSPMSVDLRLDDEGRLDGLGVGIGD